jgi:hypothetical protein
MLEQVLKECPDVPVAVFEDCGQSDGTEDYLLENATFLRRDMAYEADVYDRQGVTVYLSHSNAGVTGNSNKAMRWFMEQTDCDHLCLCNDDLQVLGPFHKTYAEAHEKLEIGLLCFCDFEGDSYKWVNVKSRGITVKMLTRMTGIMMSMTRALIADIGYYDADAFTFGQEHCDYTNRARLRGFVKLNGQPQYCLDVACPTLKHQEVNSSLTDSEKQTYNAHADVMINEVAATYTSTSLYRPFSTGRWQMTAGGRDGVGIPLAQLTQYSRVKMPTIDPECTPLHFIKKEMPTTTVDFVDDVGSPSDRLG